MIFNQTDNIYDKYSEVIELTNKDFIMKNNELILKNKNFKNVDGLIAFYAPWCGHCQNMRDMWSDLAIQFKFKFSIGAVNCENKKNVSLTMRANIEQYPTIKYVDSNGRLYNIDKLNTKDDFIAFICSKLK